MASIEVRTIPPEPVDPETSIILTLTPDESSLIEHALDWYKMKDYISQKTQDSAKALSDIIHNNYCDPDKYLQWG